MNILISILALIIGMIGLVVMMGTLFAIFSLITYLIGIARNKIAPSIRTAVENVWVTIIAVVTVILLLLCSYSLGDKIISLF